jgi:DNA repair exonuclease SbcCD ATPase subunit
MKPLRLYVENYMCFDRAYIDFTQFSSALIVGRKEDNDCHSNGVGKTSLFKAIEYVLFNQADVNLENIVRDDSAACHIVVDFLIGNQEYRVSRSRTKKGSTDLTLLQRNAQDGLEEEVYHQITSSKTDSTYQCYRPYIDKKETEKYWKDLSGSRAGDTEKDLGKLIKFTSKSFRSTVHFMQNDLAGLPTVTAEKRKGILKDALNLIVYIKLEKMAKERASLLFKDIEKHQILIEGLGDPNQDLKVLATQLLEVEEILLNKQEEKATLEEELKLYNEKVAQLTLNHSALESKFAALLAQEVSLINDRSRTEISVKEYTSKRANVIKAAKDLVIEIKTLKDSQAKLASLNYSDIDILAEQIEKSKEQITQHNLTIKNSLEKYEDLKVPLPSGSMCKNCRKPMSDSERNDCQKHISQDMKDLQKTIQGSKQIVIALNTELTKHQQTINSLNLSKQQLESINTKITNKNKEYQDKNALHDEYHGLLEKFKKELDDKTKELEAVQIELKNSSLEEANSLKSEIVVTKQKITTLVTRINLSNKEITHYNSNKAVIQHNTEQKIKDSLKKELLLKTLKELESKYAKLPAVIQGFSSIGIPNLIIQDVLDDLQIEANNLLSLLKPGLQLSFFIEKTKDDGEQADTLDIKYHINGKERYYEQLSGAMRLAVAFSLKLGLSFLLQNRIGTDIKFLLLDEIDQSLDKASVDAFADIVKFFQKDFTVLVITHNDRLKDKFSHAILVEQDVNMVSRARVVSSW